ncbi:MULTISPECIES: JAB domain-containing protein [Pontibacter]|uniref:DNA repair protein RadC n=2 Tax=Pontibacter TaxID=323449 RepID=A0A2U1B4Q0_9BACT|nr:MULTISPECIES: JAB domain-containing protein [Pontibacter]MBF8961743.1 JAB domain-containing protein [Pontibacter sp. FD36]PVY43653.1 DNA repair protein RadC [Pontibacter virosus]GGG18898.1 DNA repair protein [Pontibacter amylolyticus]
MEKLTKKSGLNRVAEIKLTYRSKVKPSERPQVTSSTDSAAVLRQSWDTGKIEFVEQFKVMLLNRANRVLGIYELSTGGVAGTVADPKLIFAAALKACASSIILCHNHPSGNTKPSAADLQLTKKMKQGGELLDIVVLDHIILTSETYYSMADEGLL